MKGKYIMFLYDKLKPLPTRSDCNLDRNVVQLKLKRSVSKFNASQPNVE